MSVLVRFLDSTSRLQAQAEGTDGGRLLDLAQAKNMPLEGTCEGSLACSTCHVVLRPEDWGKFPPPSAQEEDMLDFVAHARPTSRLSCQLYLKEGMGEVDVYMPDDHTDLRLL